MKLARSQTVAIVAMIQYLCTSIEREKTMFGVGDSVVNQNTGHIGKVIGYGHQILNGVYTTTLKVLVNDAETTKTRGLVEEDLYSVWVKL